jgi:TolA-binding protein
LREPPAPSVTKLPAHQAVVPPVPFARPRSPEKTRDDPSGNRSVVPAAVEKSRADSSVGGELASVDQAREALSKGNAARALRILDDHDARYPNGSLAQEATVVRVQALLMQGNIPRATAVGRSFVDAHPESPYAAQIRRIISD